MLLLECVGAKRQFQNNKATLYFYTHTKTAILTIAASNNIQTVLPSAQFAASNKMRIRPPDFRGKSLRLGDVMPFIGHLTAVQAFQLQKERKIRMISCQLFNTLKGGFDLQGDFHHPARRSSNLTF